MRFRSLPRGCLGPSTCARMEPHSGFLRSILTRNKILASSGVRRQHVLQRLWSCVGTGADRLPAMQPAGGAAGASCARLRVSFGGLRQQGQSACAAPSRLRALVRETAVEPGDLIYPLFLCPGEGRAPRGRLHARRLQSLHRRSGARGRRSRAARASAACCSSACPRPRTSRAPAHGTTTASCSRAARAQAIAAAKKLVLIADVCLCEYTSHGHCGVVVVETRDGFEVDNDPTLDLLARTAVSLARPEPTSSLPAT
jgi:hypothetical protein